MIFPFTKKKINMDFKENKWYNVNGDDYKCLAVVNQVGIFMQFLGLNEQSKIIKIPFESVYNYKEISPQARLVWSNYTQEETQFMIEYAELI